MLKTFNKDGIQFQSRSKSLFRDSFYKPTLAHFWLFYLLAMMESETNDTGNRKMVVVNQHEYAYEVQPFEILNSLGFVRAILKEYLVTGQSGETYKLYKTTERNWYDVEHANPTADPALLRLLKFEIDYYEKNL